MTLPSRIRTALPATQLWVVGIATDAASNYGRLITRGILRYANTRREWLLHQELRIVSNPLSTWPRCDGTIFTGMSPESLVQLRQNSRHLLSCSASTDPSLIPVVCADGYAIGRVAAEHLLDLRLKCFGFYGRDDRTSMDRAAGFSHTVEARQFPCSIHSAQWTIDQWVTHAHWPRALEWLRGLPKPAGILAVDDTEASDLAAACLASGINVPDQVAIVGVNNDDLLCEGSWPSLSSVEVDFTRVGYLAARQMDGLLNGDVLPATERITRVPPLGVVRRMSTDIQAVDDPELAKAVAFIRDHACEPCSVGDVLRQVPVSRSWLERQFVQKLGRTPHDEIIRVRMDRARRLLLESDEAIPQIASRCGFSAVQNFARSFRQEHDKTPAAFRRENRRVGV